MVQIHPRDTEAVLCILADGSGGRHGGAVASQIAVEECRESASEYSVKQLLNRSSWDAIFKAVDKAVAEHADTGFTTLIGLCVAGGKVCGASCGDSTALIIGKNTCLVLTEKQRKNPPVGSGAAQPTAFTANLKGSTLLIMSDGVWRFVGYDTIAELSRAKQGQELILALRELQLEQNGGKLPDDFSIIVTQ